MNDFQKSQAQKILSMYNNVENFIEKSEELEKGGKRAFIGEVRKYNGQDWVKHHDGWVLLNYSSGKHILERTGGKREEASKEHVEHAKKHMDKQAGDELQRHLNYKKKLSEEGGVKEESKSIEKEVTEQSKEKTLEEVDYKVAEKLLKDLYNQDQRVKDSGYDMSEIKKLDLIEREIVKIGLAPKIGSAWSKKHTPKQLHEQYIKNGYSWLVEEEVKPKVKSIVEDKDWDRMADLFLNEKSPVKVANAITDKRKAIARFVAGSKIANDTLEYRDSWKQYSNTFSAFGNRALELGATKEEIEEAFNNAEIPDKIEEKVKKLADKKLNNRFIGSLSKKVLDAGYDINFEKTNGYAITRAGKDAMSRNGRKWTIGYKSEIDLGNGKKVKLVIDAITDEGDGPTSYIVDTSGSDSIFNHLGSWEGIGITKLTSDVLTALSKHK